MNDTRTIPDSAAPTQMPPFLEEFLSAGRARTNLSERTIVAYGTDIRQFFSILPPPSTYNC
jgi:site-specific recombinase XerD